VYDRKDITFSQNDYQNEKKKGQITKKPLNINAEGRCKD